MFVLGASVAGVAGVEQNLKGRCSLCGMGGSQGMRLQLHGLRSSVMAKRHAGLPGRQKPRLSRFYAEGLTLLRKGRSCGLVKIKG